MEITAVPSEPFFSMWISKYDHNIFFGELLLSRFYLPILEEIVLRDYYVASWSTVYSNIVKNN